MVFIWAPLSKRTMQLSLFIFHFSYVFNPVSLLERVQIQEGSLQSGLYACGASIWSFLCACGVEGSGLPSLKPSTPSHLTAFCPSGLHKWAIMDEMFWATTVVTAFHICLGIFHCPCQLDHELFCHPSIHQDHHSLDLHFHQHPLPQGVLSGQWLFK